MPLPAIRNQTALQCKAKAKHSQVRCLNPAAYGMPVCRFHGARKPQTVLKGKDHPNYRHTLDAKQKRREMSCELAELWGLLSGCCVVQERGGGRQGVARSNDSAVYLNKRHASGGQTA